MYGKTCRYRKGTSDRRAIFDAAGAVNDNIGSHTTTLAPVRQGQEGFTKA